MRRTLRILLAILAGIIIIYGCDSGGSDSLNPTITSIQPETGPPGTAVTISGSDFSPNPSENTVLFDETSAPVNSVTETEIETEVPEALETGEVELEVSVDGNTAAGPSFTVEAKAPGISSVEPDSGTVGMEVTIQGMNFSSSAAENTITFAGTDAPVNGAAEDQLLTEVPQGAQDGPVEVTVNGKTAIGPDFDVITTGSLEVITSTSGENQDNENEYKLLVDGAAQAIGANETSLIPDLEEGSYQVELTDIAKNCGVDGDNPRNVEILAGETTSITFDVNCQTVLKDQIVFASDRDGDNEIFVMNADGSNPTQLTNNSTEDIIPVVSNDGTQIAFTSARNGTANLFIMDADGSNVRELTKSSGLSRLPSWSPDDEEIVYMDNYTGNQEIYKINVDGTSETQLTNHSDEDQSPSWAPSGNKIAFNSNRDGDHEIYTINTDGTGIQQITNNSFDDHLSRWSPSGNRFLFWSEENDSEIMVMNSDGTGLQQLTDNSENDGYASWSPDGSEIVFHTNRDGQFEIYKMNADGTGTPINLTVTNNSHEIAPFWSPVE